MKATLQDVPYGPHEMNVLDLYRAPEPSGSTFLWIHGGGFHSGDKSDSAKLHLLCVLHSSGISIVTVNYRLTQQTIYLGPFHDCRRALQFVRRNARAWGLDPSRIGVGGVSAGAGMARWLGLRPNMAESESEDPIARESTTPNCVCMMDGQTSYDPRFIAEEIGGDGRLAVNALSSLFGVPRDRWPHLYPDERRLVEEASPINSLTKHAPPVFSTYSMAADAPPDIHHPRFSLCLKDRMEEFGCDCTILIDEGLSKSDSSRQSMANAVSSFLARNLGERSREASTSVGP